MYGVEGSTGDIEAAFKYLYDAEEYARIKSNKFRGITFMVFNHGANARFGQIGMIQGTRNLICLYQEGERVDRARVDEILGKDI